MEFVPASELSEKRRLELLANGTQLVLFAQDNLSDERHTTADESTVD